MAKPKRRSIRGIFTVIGVATAAVGWSTLLWPPVKFYSNRADSTVWSTIFELLKLPSSAIYPDGFAVGYLFIISSLLLLIAFVILAASLVGGIIRYRESSEADVTLLEMQLVYRFEDRLSRVIATREQLFHANAHGLTAYHYSQTTEAPASVIKPESFEMTSILNGNRVTDDFIIRSHSPKKFEAIEIFKHPLPTNILATYLPDWLVLLLWHHSKWLNAVIVERTGQIEIMHEHDGEDAIVELRSLKRRAKRVTVVLDFPLEFAPRQPDMKCFLIRDNVVSGLYPRSHTVGPRRLYTAYVEELDHETLRFQWNNRRLHDPVALAPIDAASAVPVPIGDRALAKLIRRIFGCG